MKGYVHSIQSLGAVDGPGVRSVVFLQGCPLRCAYCHNPDTWEMPVSGLKSDGKNGESNIPAQNGGDGADILALEPEELVKKLLRFRSYFGRNGGVTISGGEPLMQPQFTARVMQLLREAQIHTALDTSGQAPIKMCREVLAHTDLALVDVKFLTDEEYRTHTGGSLKSVDRFLNLTAELSVPVWIRHVVVPGLTAFPNYLHRIEEKARQLPNLKKIEWLPFHKLCMEKYQRLGIPFPLGDTPQLTQKELEKLLADAHSMCIR